MTRVELSSILADLISRGAITADEAAEVLREYDDGALTDVLLPATQPQADNRWVLALTLLLFLLNGSLRQSARGRLLLRQQFENRTSQLAAQLVAGGTVTAWQNGMSSSIDLYARQMAIAGAGKLPSAATQRAVDERLSGQGAFLAGFAVALLVGRLANRMMSEAAISARSKLYGGTGWGAYYQGQGYGAIAGYVDKWITRDDKIVCSKCRPRHNQYYLPGVGIMPGWDCLGTCRCQRVREFNPQAYAALGGK